jgi:hypothetical protein
VLCYKGEGFGGCGCVNNNKLKLADIKQLNMKEYIEFTKKRIEIYYKNKLNNF